MRLIMKTLPQSRNTRRFLIIGAMTLLGLISVVQKAKITAALGSVHLAVEQHERDIKLSTSNGAEGERREHCEDQVYSLHGPGPDKETYSGGWAVRRLCSPPVDTLFFVHSAPKNWKLRVHLRETLFEKAARVAFNWTGVFFVEEHDDPLVNLWTKLEVEAAGDVVMVPYKETYVSTAHKYVGGMRWVTEHCANVRVVVKIDDDIGVQPFELRRYLDEKVSPRKSSIHCVVRMNTGVKRNLPSTHCISEDNLDGVRHSLYCSGRCMIMTMDTMRKLSRASKLAKGYAVDGAYVSGPLAMIAKVAHENISSRVALDSGDKTERLLQGGVIFVNEHFANESSVGRRVQWGVMLWKHLVDAPGTLNFSDRLADKLYRLDFLETRRALEERWYLPHPDDYSSGHPHRLVRVIAEKNGIINQSRIAASP